jgi:hypothetical protein
MHLQGDLNRGLIHEPRAGAIGFLPLRWRFGACVVRNDEARGLNPLALTRITSDLEN